MGDGVLAERPQACRRCGSDAPPRSQRTCAERARPKSDRRIAFRIGINIGDIIIEDDDIFGDGVNVAARLERLAEPGGICVGAQRLQPGVDQGHLRLRVDGRARRSKNIPEPVIAYRSDGTDGPIRDLVWNSARNLRSRRLAGVSRRGRPRSGSGGMGVAFWLQPVAALRGTLRAPRVARPLPERTINRVLPFGKIFSDPRARVLRRRHHRGL